MLSYDIAKDVFIQQRLGPAVLAAALALEASDPNIATFRFMLDNARDVISLANPSTVGGINYLVYKGILTQADATRILAPVEIPDAPVEVPPVAPDLSGWSLTVGHSTVSGTQIETQVRFTCDADDARSFSQSFVHADEADLVAQATQRLIAAKNPPTPLLHGAVLVIG
jgi:hypothetical protein